MFHFNYICFLIPLTIFIIIVVVVLIALVTSYAYPMDASVLKRTAALPLSPKQYVYVGMENGSLYRIDIISERSIVFTLIQDEKSINPVGSGMTVLCLDPEIGDFVIFSGEMSDGAVVMVKKKSFIIYLHNTCHDNYYMNYKC